MSPLMINNALCKVDLKHAFLWGPKSYHPQNGFLFNCLLQLWWCKLSTRVHSVPIGRLQADSPTHFLKLKLQMGFQQHSAEGCISSQYFMVVLTSPHTQGTAYTHYTASFCIPTCASVSNLFAATNMLTFYPLCLSKQHTIQLDFVPSKSPQCPRILQIPDSFSPATLAQQQIVCLFCIYLLILLIENIY